LRHPPTEEVLQALLELLWFEPVTGITVGQAPVNVRAVRRIIEQATTK
jgi:hypothetical protein